ncbi:MAG: Cupin 2 conserved barrel domain protein [Pseudonocardiales bacterium]|nr:Cupin 2 conserved barrel domain protein [Pseudonocardiales bacterium]
MAAPPVLVPPSELRAYQISPGDTVKLVVLAGPATGSSTTVVFEIWEPGGAQPPNSHPDSAETFVVLAGSAVAHSDEHALKLQAGDTLVLQPGSVHRIVNASDAERLYTLTVMASDGGFADLITNGSPVPLDAQDLAVLGGSAL